MKVAKVETYHIFVNSVNSAKPVFITC